jgi:hypothetical protein
MSDTLHIAARSCERTTNNFGARAHHPQKRGGARRKCCSARSKFAHCLYTDPNDPPAIRRVLDATSDSTGKMGTAYLRRCGAAFAKLFVGLSSLHPAPSIQHNFGLRWRHADRGNVPAAPPLRSRRRTYKEKRNRGHFPARLCPLAMVFDGGGAKNWAQSTTTAQSTTAKVVGLKNFSVRPRPDRFRVVE